MYLPCDWFIIFSFHLCIARSACDGVLETELERSWRLTSSDDVLITLESKSLVVLFSDGISRFFSGEFFVSVEL